MIYLAGDSVFDNAPYTSPSLIEQMGDGARLLARDGAVIASVMEQFAVPGLRPTAADLLVLSVGGNDALRWMDLVTNERHTAPAALAALALRSKEFELSYRVLLAMLQEMTFGKIACCTIYNGNFSDDAAAISAGVRIFDDAIQCAARRSGARVLELRDIFTSPADYANPIEPSNVGGAKLAAAIRSLA